MKELLHNRSGRKATKGKEANAEMLRRLIVLSFLDF
jgi:hypothetical protein